MTDTSEPLGAIQPEPITAPYEQPPNYRLYTPDMVGGASFLGGALAGGYLLYLNSKQLKDGKGGQAMLVGLAITVATIGLAYTLPDGFPGVILGAGALGAMRAYSMSIQGVAVREHLSSGGRKGSAWKVAGVVLLSCLLIVGIIFGGVYLTMAPSFHLGKDEVLYQGGAKESEAKALAEELKKIGYFSDSGSSVYLTRRGAELHVGMVVKDGAWDSAETCEAFRSLTPEISKTVFGGSPVVIELMNDAGDIKKTL